MSKNYKDNLVGNESLTIVEAMQLIDDNAKGILFVVNDNDELIGALTDGDIRRWILKKGSLDASIVNAMTKKPKWLSVDNSGNARELMLKNVITALPIVNSENKIERIEFLTDAEIKKAELKANLSGVPVVIMAGGKGTRLYPFTKILPKPLIPIDETPIVERIINCFTEYGIDKIHMTVNYKKEMIKAYFNDKRDRYVIEYVEEDVPLGTGGSIKLIDEAFDKPIIVANCDSLILVDYGKMYEHHIQSGNTITMVTAVKNITVPYGVINAGENGEIISLEEKPTLSYFINTGMYIINPEIINMIPEGEVFHMTHLVEAAMEAGEKVGMYPISEDSFLDMGEFEEMKRMEEKLNMASKK